LRLPALLFRAGAALNAWLYERGLRPRLRVAAPVVSVGNLSAGGTGKTPMVAWLARWFQEQGLQPGIVSRGYKAAAQGTETNDEARMLERELPGVPHEQDPNRVAGAQRLVELGVDVVLADDGFQHRRLVRDLDLVLVDAARPFGLPAANPDAAPVHAMLPRGLLREPLAALQRADFVILTRSDAVSPERRDALLAHLTKAAPGVPQLIARHAPTRLVDTAGVDLGLERLRELELDLLTGVGNPEAVEETVRELGATLGSHRARPDHHTWTAADLEGLGQRPVLTTAKDRPKLEALAQAANLELWTLEVQLEFLGGEDKLLERLAGLPPADARRERDAIHGGLHG
jgi:tetraacyldisaccharide 4'-kinase